MAIFAGRYRWDGTKKGEQEPIAWSAGAYDLRIFKCALQKKVQHLKPFVCIFAATGEGQSISANPERFAKQICHDFALDIERVLWIEDQLTDMDRYLVVQFSQLTKIGSIVLYTTTKRAAHASELQLIERELTKFCNEWFIKGWKESTVKGWSLHQIALRKDCGSLRKKLPKQNGDCRHIL